MVSNWLLKNSQEPLSTELENKRKSIDKRLMWSNSKYTSQYQIYITLQVYKICKGIYISTIKRKTLNKKNKTDITFEYTFKVSL